MALQKYLNALVFVFARLLAQGACRLWVVCDAMEMVLYSREGGETLENGCDINAHLVTNRVDYH